MVATVHDDAALFLRMLFDAAVDAARPDLCVPPFLPSAPTGRMIVIGAGKAAAAMALAVDRHWPGPLSGVVVTATGCEVPCPRVAVLRSGHPVPMAEGEAAARTILGAVEGLGSNDLVICLISGGGSALLSLPADGVALEDKQAITRALLRSGATISEINCVRRHLSRIKGGRLAAACHPARVVTLAISDVPGDDPADIASGPTVADATTCAMHSGCWTDFASQRRKVYGLGSNGAHGSRSSPTMHGSQVPNSVSWPPQRSHSRRQRGWRGRGELRH
jgi:hydroxypyruvate reductase